MCCSVLWGLIKENSGLEHIPEPHLCFTCINLPLTSRASGHMSFLIIHFLFDLFYYFLWCFKEILMLLTAFNSSCSMLRWCLCQTADSSPSASGSAGLTPLSKPPGSFNTAFQQGFGLCLTRFLNAPEIIKITCEHTTYHHHMWRPVDKMQFGVLHCHSATSKQCK